MTKIAIWFMVGWLLIAFVFYCAGCHGLKPASTGPPLPDPGPIARLTDAVKESNWIISVAIIGAAISIAAFINGSRSAFGPLVGSLAALGLALMVSRFAGWIALMALVGSAGIFIWSVLRKKKTFTELVKTVEYAKTQIPGPTSAYIKDGMRKIQSPVTEKIANKIRYNNSLGRKINGD